MPGPGTKIPMWRNVGQAYGEAVENIGSFWRISLIWMLVAYGAEFTGDFLAASSGEWRYLLIGLVAYWLAVTAVAVSWHRVVLLGDRPEGLIWLRFGQRERRFAKISLAFLAVLFGPPLVLFGPSWIAGGGLPHNFAGVIWSMYLLALISMAFLCRLSLLLPAIAVDDRGMTLARAWAATNGNLLRIFFGGWVATLPFDIAIRVIEHFREIFADKGASFGIFLATDLLATVISFYGTIVGIGFLSLAYFTLTDGPQEESSPEATASS